MSENRNLLFGFLLALVLAGVLEWFVLGKRNDYDRQFIQTRESVVMQKKAELAELPQPADVLFLGDSTVKSGIDDNEFYKRTGLKSLNLGLNGELASYSEYFMLKSYLEHQPPPKAIVIWHALDVWPRNLNLRDFFFTLPNGEDQIFVAKNLLKNMPMNQNIIYWPIKMMSQIIQGICLNIFPSYRYKVWLKKDAANMVAGLDPLAVLESLRQQDMGVHHRLQAQIKSVYVVPLNVAEDNKKWLLRCAQLAQKHNIKVLISRAPVRQEFFDDAGAQKFLSALNEKVTAFLSNHDKWIQISTDYFVLKPHETNDDKDHANEQGRLALTRQYASLVPPYLD